MFENILSPAFGLIVLTFAVGLLHTIASVDLTRKSKEWEESGIPREPYEDAPLKLRLLKNNISNLFEFTIIFYFLVGLILILDLSNAFLIICAWLYFLFRVIHSVWHIYFIDTSVRGSLWLFSQIILFIFFLGTVISI